MLINKKIYIYNVWMFEIGECLHTPNRLVNVEKLKLYRHLLVDVDIYIRILVNVDIGTTYYVFAHIICE